MPNAIIAGTSYEGRAYVIKKHIKPGMQIVLKREPKNRYDKNAIAVYLMVPVLFGLLGKSAKKIGYIQANRAKTLAPKMDNGFIPIAKVASFFFYDDTYEPRVSIEYN